ncbi:MAG: HD domain-containing phosphohydrolase [Vulcanimicrobiota bacterium]
MRHVLLFDSEKEKLERIKEILEKNKLHVLTAGDLDQFNKYIDEFQPSAVVINTETKIGKSFYEETLKPYYNDKNRGVYFIISDIESEFSPLNFSGQLDGVVLENYIPEELALQIINFFKNRSGLFSEFDEEEKIKVLYRINSISPDKCGADGTIDEVLNILTTTFNARSAVLYLKDENDSIQIFRHLGEVDKKDLKELFQFTTRIVLTQKKFLYFSDARDELFWTWASWNRPDQLNNWVAGPIFQKGEPIGTIELFGLPDAYFDERDPYSLDFIKEVLREAEKVISLSMKISKMDENLQYAVDELSILYEISDALSSTLNLDELLKLIVRKAMKSFNAQVASLMMLDIKNKELRIRFAEGLSPEIIENTRVKVGEGISGRVARTGEPLLLVDVVGIDTNEITKDIKSALCVPLKIKSDVIGVLNVSKTSRYQFTETDLKLLYNLASLAAQALEKAELYSDLKNSLGEIKNSYMNTISALSKAIEAKDPYTQGHIDRVAKYGMAIALELDPELLKDDMFRYALALHDIGKIEVPDTILTKPGALTSEEMAIIQRHPETGAQIIQPINFLKDAAEMVRCHQERWDGTGYPSGLKGEEIPLAARIISVADAFDAITTNRPYRNAKSEDYARDEIVKGAGTQFDPQVVEAFLAVLDKKVVN